MNQNGPNPCVLRIPGDFETMVFDGMVFLCETDVDVKELFYLLFLFYFLLKKIAWTFRIDRKIEIKIKIIIGN